MPRSAVPAARRRASALVPLLVLLLGPVLVASACASGGDDEASPPSSVAGPPVERPNILYVFADDLADDDLEHLPHVRRLLTDHGVELTSAYVSVSLCCPSRSTVLRGQYSHNTGVETNRGNGGFEVFHERGLEESTVGTWLQEAGYRTALVGKYLNDYPGEAGDAYVPPGWDHWAAPVGSTNEQEGGIYRQYGYTLNRNGTLVEHGDAPEDYAGTVFVDEVADFVDDAAERGDPFFAYLSLVSPHAPATPAPGDEDAYPDATAPRTPSYDQADVSAMPQWVRDRPRINDFDQAYLDGLQRARLQSLLGVDRAVRDLVRTLRDNGQLDDTYVVFTSDNGHHLGQHRLQSGKLTAYEEDVHVPLVVRGPGIPEGERSDALVLNTDLAPTFAALAGAEVPDFVDGRSFADVLFDPSAPFPRQSVLLAHYDEELRPGQDHSAIFYQDDTPELHGLRTRRWTYVEYVTGERELYDNDADPDQLENLAADADPALLEALSGRVADLAGCAAEGCRTAEDAAVP